jgi:hypothetical protein
MACGVISESPTRATSSARAPNPPLISRPSRFGSRQREKQGKRKDSFAERNERFRDAGRKSLRSLGREIGEFRAIVYLQWLAPLFVSA